MKNKVDKVDKPTLRDQFAMAALNALIQPGWDGSYEYFADHAYGFADAMLKEREK